MKIIDRIKRIKEIFFPIKEKIYIFCKERDKIIEINDKVKVEELSTKIHFLFEKLEKNTEIYANEIFDNLTQGDNLEDIVFSKRKNHEVSIPIFDKFSNKNGYPYCTILHVFKNPLLNRRENLRPDEIIRELSYQIGYLK